MPQFVALKRSLSELYMGINESIVGQQETSGNDATVPKGDETKGTTEGYNSLAIIGKENNQGKYSHGKEYSQGRPVCLMPE